MILNERLAYVSEVDLTKQSEWHLLGISDNTRRQPGTSAPIIKLAKEAVRLSGVWGCGERGSSFYQLPRRAWLKSSLQHRLYIYACYYKWE